MPLLAGTRLGPYEILSPIGAGGMGEVYKCRDTRLNRIVAVKVLPAERVADQERRQRFIQEAQAASALNHPGIIGIYDIAIDNGRDYIVMEYVAGKTVDALIQSGGMRLGELLKIAIPVADGLSAAHGARIIHRDLKPSNIIVSENGQVKILDFGLAKLLEPEQRMANDAATRSLQAKTAEGTVLGTAPYMSPEQAEGKPLDVRSDIFSFGAVLYEMATGQRAFQGASHASILGAVLDKEPTPVREIAPAIPLELEKIITRCLRKDPERRAQHMGDLKLALQELKEDSESGKLPAAVPGGAAVRPPARSRLRLAAIGASAVALLVAAGVAVQHWRKPSAPVRSEWVQITNMPDPVGQPALSPDGRMLTFIRGLDTFIARGQVYVKMLPSGEPVELTHDDHTKMSPVFSPDGSRIAYSVGGHIWDTWIVPVLGGEPRLWLPNASGLVWIDKSKLLFSEIKDKALHMALVTAEESRAGSRDVFVPPHERGMAHRSYLSPDRKSILMVEMGGRGGFMPCRLLPFDGSSPGQQVGPPGAACTFAAWSPSGDWMYFTSSAGGGFHIWRQRFPDGQPQQLTSGPTEEEGIAMAPDGRSFITAVGVKQSSVWLHDSRGERQISLEGQAFQPKFTPDGKRLCYRVRTGASSELWVAELDSGRREALLPGFALVGEPSVSNSPYDISADGREVVLASADQAGKTRLWVAPFDRRSPPRQIPGVEGEQPVFAGGEVFFRVVEGSSAFLYRVGADGANLRKASNVPVIAVMGVSADRRALIVGSPKEGTLVIVRTDGGAQLVLPGAPALFQWSADGKYLFVEGTLFGRQETQVLPVPPGRVLPESFSERFPSEAEIAKLPEVRVIPSVYAAPGPTADVYAFTRETVQRNLYRIPVP